MLGGRGVRMVIQAIYFLVIARALGASHYGAFVGAVSLVAIAVPFSSWGMGFILIRKVSRDRTAFRRSWGDALCVTLISGGILLGLAALTSRWVWGRSIPVSVLLLVGMSDLFAVRLVDLATQAFVAVELLRKTAEVNVILSLSRLLGAAVLPFAVARPTVSSWTMLYLATGVIAAAYSFVAVTRTLGRPEFALRMSRAEFADSTAALRWLSPLILFKCIHYFYADCLSGAGFQGVRAAIQLAIAGVNVLLNLWLIPAYSWKGAAWASIASDGALAMFLYAATATLEHRKKPADSSCALEPNVAS